MDLKIADESEVRWLYQQMLEWWNERSASMMVALCTHNATMVGFDGSLMSGRAEIHTELNRIFSVHKPGSYVWRVKEVHLLSPDVAVLRAIVGMVPKGMSDVNPEVNAIQIMTAVKEHGGWSIALFQNTPAAFHGRAQLSRELTEELRQVLANRKKVVNGF